MFLPHPTYQLLISDNRVPSGRRFVWSLNLSVLTVLKLCGDVLTDVVGTAVDLAAHAQHTGAVLVLELDAEVIEDLAEVGVDAHLAATHADGLHRVPLQGPVGDVDVVDVLFDDVVARQPGEVQPVARLPLHVGPAGLPLAVP